jgi:cell division transport system permease protein
MSEARNWAQEMAAAPVPAALAAAEALRGAARETSLVPPSTISARSLVMVITIMSFLASIAAGSAVLVGRASQQWSADLAREASVQIRARAGLDMDAEAERVARLVRAGAGVTAAHVFSKAESEGLLEPWLGQNLNFEDLPVPRLIVVTFDPSAQNASESLRQSLAKNAPNATFDDHRAWSERLSTMGRTLVLIAVGMSLLILLAMALAVAFATSGAMAGSREIVDVLHLVGASDGFISRQYQRQFLVFGLKGGFYGALAASLVFIIFGQLSRYWASGAGGGQVEALFGQFSLGGSGYLAVAMIALFTTAITVLTSHVIVTRQLRTLV